MEHTKPTRSRKPRVQSVPFDLTINARQYAVAATQYSTPSGDIQYRVSYNNGPVYIFAWDEGLDRFAVADNHGEPIAPVVEMSIADKLQQVASQMQEAA